MEMLMLDTVKVFFDETSENVQIFQADDSSYINQIIISEESLLKLVQASQIFRLYKKTFNSAPLGSKDISEEEYASNVPISD